MTSWTADRTERLKKLWADGVSGSEIGEELHCSRNSVIGKVHRLGLPERAKHPKPGPKPGKPRTPKPGRLTVKGTGFVAKLFAQPSPAPLIEAPPLIVDGPQPGRCSILDLTSTTCRWIVGDSKKPLEAIYCGVEPWGCGYCATHLRRALTPEGLARVMAVSKRAA
jgi:GcrA cell cycle regulator